jgi:endo-1,4-beta-xylanase
MQARWLIVAAFLAAAGVPTQTLRQAADHAGILVGTAVRPYALSEAAYSETLAREYNMIEPEVAMKWEAVRPTEAAFDFREGDALVRFAQAHRMKIRGHCLVWDHSNPDWLAHGQFTPAQLATLLHEHINTVMKHYAGQVFAWDVVNEALDQNGHPKDSPWYNQPGIGLSGKGAAYIEQAFRWARAADPQALLFYNEAEGEKLNPKSDAIYVMLKDFKRRGVPIDGIGLQMHISSTDFDEAALANNIARLAGLGLQVHITELDVALPLISAGNDSTGNDSAGSRAREDDLQRQADVYRGVVRACLRSPGCTAIQTWGFTDKYSWIGSHSHHTMGAALPFDQSYKPKPAYDAMMEEMLRHNPATASRSNSQDK